MPEVLSNKDPGQKGPVSACCTEQQGRTPASRVCEHLPCQAPEKAQPGKPSESCQRLEKISKCPVSCASGCWLPWTSGTARSPVIQAAAPPSGLVLTRGELPEAKKLLIVPHPLRLWPLAPPCICCCQDPHDPSSCITSMPGLLQGRTESSRAAAGANSCGWPHAEVSIKPWLSSTAKRLKKRIWNLSTSRTSCRVNPHNQLGRLCVYGIYKRTVSVHTKERVLALATEDNGWGRYTQEQGQIRVWAVPTAGPENRSVLGSLLRWRWNYKSAYIFLQFFLSLPPFILPSFLFHIVLMWFLYYYFNFYLLKPTFFTFKTSYF